MSIYDLTNFRLKITILPDAFVVKHLKAQSPKKKQKSNVEFSQFKNQKKNLTFVDLCLLILQILAKYVVYKIV